MGYKVFHAPAASFSGSFKALNAFTQSGSCCIYQVLVLKTPFTSSNQKAPVGVWPAGRIDARSFSETPTTLDLKFVASISSSVIVVASKLRGDILPAVPVPPAGCTVLSSTQ